MAIFKQGRFKFIYVLLSLFKHSCVQENLEQYKILGKNTSQI